MERLTDKQLADLDQWAACDLGPRDGAEVAAAIDEIRERRSADLSDADREALGWARKYVNIWIDGERHTRALAVLDRLIAGGKT